MIFQHKPLKFVSCALLNYPKPDLKPFLSLQNSAHVTQVKAAIKKNPQSVKSAVAELESKIGLPMHPETLKRFKNLVSVYAASAPASSSGK